ncbi:unnamed protein product [Rotaria socialis]|uniref:Cyclin N-terminal domain-containing protein n=1 Tax=Rotaria socialis TaxID=392032 RepID=A0A819ZEZ0_9BILA|nr:unnamed protein product [Rotaria socialis]CAF3424149.1 unnamed protein product [Rotaria socialis]CAF4173323.1 unnamed protein product [Rotaria socialis]CAF4334431.1 unnamed protein product [Rotaria socialis]
MQRIVTSLEQCMPSCTIERSLTKDQIISTISSWLTKHCTKIAVFSTSNNLLYSWRDAYYSNNIPHIDHVIQVFTSLYREFYLLDHLTNILISEYHSLYTYDYAILWCNTDLTKREVRLSWRCSIVNWLIGIQRKNNMKPEVTQHAVRLIDAIDTLKGRNERTYQLRAMAFFILSAKFHNRSRIRMEEFSRYAANAFEPREIGDCMRTVNNELNFEVQLPLVLDFLELYLELNSNETFQLNTPKIRALAILFIHVVCIQSWSSCFNASLVAGSVLILCLKFLQDKTSIPQLCSIVWLFDHSIELMLGLAGYIALIVSDMPSIPRDRSNYYFYAHKMYNDECRHKIDDDFKFDHVKTFCRIFVQTSDINRQISCGMRSLVFNQLCILENAYPSLLCMNMNQNRSDDIKDKCRSMQFTIRVVLAAKRFAKHILEKRKTMQQLKATSLIE